MKIGIELNGIIRNLNFQVLKYYTNDINKGFDDEKVDVNVVNIFKQLPFESKKAMKSFIFEDYPYELFGCAKPMTSGLGGLLNTWILDLDDDGHDVSFFSLKENGLTIQSSYFFLSKIGSRVREMIFPKQESDVWDRYDVVITNNKTLLATKPIDKVSVKIKTNDKGIGRGDLSYNTMLEILQDEEFILKVQGLLDERQNIKKPWKEMWKDIKSLFQN